MSNKKFSELVVRETIGVQPTCEENKRNLVKIGFVEYVKCDYCDFHWNPEEHDECPDCKYIRDTSDHTDPQKIGILARIMRAALNDTDREILKWGLIACGKEIPKELEEPERPIVIPRGEDDECPYKIPRFEIDDR